MCGILAAFGLTGTPEQNRRELLKLSKLLRHRGPDANSAYTSQLGDVGICHERLQIVDVTDAGRWGWWRRFCLHPIFFWRSTCNWLVF